MDSIHSAISYTISFLAIYAQVFLLVTFFEKRKYLVRSDDAINLESYPTVTITVPFYNEQDTISGTVESLLSMDYPQEMLTIYLIDDGSKDNTWEVVQKFKDYPNIKLFQKENGGKHTAMNLGISKSTSEFFGCLDSDSYVDPQALKRMMKIFQEDPRVMACAPAIRVNNPTNFLQRAQKIEYDMGIYNKKMIGFIGGIGVTPGPFSIFRKKVFDDLGPYTKAHNTEDQEIALRMQEHGYKIEHCADAYVYTNAPNSLGKLYRQRIRWNYGTLKNIIDYRRLLFNKKYGSIGIFTIPTNLLSVFGVLFIATTIVFNAYHYIAFKIFQIRTVGFGPAPHSFHFNWFFLDTTASVMLSATAIIFVLVSIIISKQMTKEKIRPSLGIMYFFIFYTILAPLWVIKSVWNVLVSKETSWTSERKAVKVNSN